MIKLVKFECGCKGLIDEYEGQGDVVWNFYSCDHGRNDDPYIVGERHGLLTKPYRDLSRSEFSELMEEISKRVAAGSLAIELAQKFNFLQELVKK